MIVFTLIGLDYKSAIHVILISVAGWKKKLIGLTRKYICDNLDYKTTLHEYNYTNTFHINIFCC